LTRRPDRSAKTLATLPETSPGDAAVHDGLPPAGAADARIDLKLMQDRLRRALAERGTAAARERIAGLDRPDLVAGTVQDGVARGLLVPMEEALDLCAPSRSHFDPEPHPEDQEFGPEHLSGNRRRRGRTRGGDFLVASAGARVRFSRKGGVLFVHRDDDRHLSDFLRFEDRRDVGTLDGFEPVHDERARLFSPAFLQPTSHVQARSHQLLRLEGRLGRGRGGFDTWLEFEGRPDETFVRLRVGVHNEHVDHRLRIRFLGLPRDAIAHLCTDVVEEVCTPNRRFTAATLVRACGRLDLGDGTVISVPGAQCIGWIEHEFHLRGSSDRGSSNA